MQPDYFLSVLYPKEEVWEVRQCDHKKKTGCGMKTSTFMKEVWTVAQSCRNQFILNTGLNRILMQEILDKFDNSELIQQLMRVKQSFL